MPVDYVENQRQYNTFHSNGRIEVYEEEAVKLVLLISKLLLNHVPASLLDVGCRSGYLLDALATKFPAARIAGVDIVPEFVAMASETGCEAQVADMHALPFEDREFDWVVCSQTLEHCYDVAQGVRELCRVAATGVLISMPLENDASYNNNPSHYARTYSTFGWLELFPQEGWQLLYAKKNGDVFDFALIREDTYATNMPRV